MMSRNKILNTLIISIAFVSIIFAISARQIFASNSGWNYTFGGGCYVSGQLHGTNWCVEDGTGYHWGSSSICTGTSWYSVYNPGGCPDGCTCYTTTSRNYYCGNFCQEVVCPAQCVAKDCTLPSCPAGTSTTPGNCGSTTVRCSRNCGQSDKVGTCYNCCESCNTPPTISGVNYYINNSLVGGFNFSLKANNTSSVPDSQRTLIPRANSLETGTFDGNPSTVNVPSGCQAAGTSKSQSDTNPSHAFGSVGNLTETYIVNKKCSGTITASMIGYYKVNSNPKIDRIVETDHTPATTPENCSDNGYTGGVINRSVSFTATFSDADESSNINGMTNYQDIKAMYITFSAVSKAGSAVPNKIYSSEATGVYNNVSNEFSFMIRRADGDNSYDIFVPSNGGYAHYTPAQTGIISITNQYGEIAQILGLKLYKTSPTDNKVLLDFTVNFQSNLSGGNYSIYAAVNDKLGFLNNGNTIRDPKNFSSAMPIVNNTNGLGSTIWTVDFIPPSFTVSPQPLSISSSNKYTMNISNLSDGSGSGIYALMGGATWPAGVVTPFPISATPGTIGYKNYGSSQSPMGFGKNNLFYFSPIASSGTTETIDIGQNECTLQNGCQWAFSNWLFDRACNLNNTPANAQMWTPWTITRGGFVHSGGAILDFVQSINNANLWQNPAPTYTLSQNLVTGNYGYDPANSEISTEYMNSGKSYTPITNDSKIYLTQNYTNEKNQYIAFADMIGDISAQKNKFPSNYADSTTAATTLGGSVTCASSNCIFRYSASTVTVNSVLKCLKPTLFVMTGDLKVENNIVKSDGPNSLTMNDCMFLVQGKVDIYGDQYNDSNKVSYRRIDAYIIGFDQITLMNQNVTNTITNDGLIVNGGIIGFGGTTPSIRNSKTFKLVANQVYSSLLVHVDPAYSYLSRTFFGGVGIYGKKEVGFKNL